MKFLDRSNSNRVRKDPKGRVKDDTVKSLHPDAIEPIDQAGEKRQAMSKRPNTSAGVERRPQRRGSSKTRDAIKDAVRQAAKDPKCSEDLHQSVPTVEITEGVDVFRFPTPSPRMPPRSATFQHSPSPLNYESPRIGVAIGSPSNAPPNWGRSFTADYISNKTRQVPPSRLPPPPPVKSESNNASLEQRKKKSSGWKAFGDMFRKSSKRASNKESLYSCKPGPAYSEMKAPAPCTTQINTLAPSEATSPVLPSPRPVTAQKTHSRTSSFGRSGTRLEARQQGERTSFMPTLKARMMRAPSSRGDITFSPRVNPFKTSEDIFKVTEERHDSPMSQQNDAIDSIPIPRTPKLDLDLPISTFDRYSVMFEKVLANESRPSLLERRQSRLHLQRQKSNRRLGEGDSGDRLSIKTPTSVLPQRSLTSPHLSRSLSIKVDGNKSDSATSHLQSTAVHRPRPVQRSKTAPPMARSPLSAAFMRDRQGTMESRSSPESPRSDFHSENSLPPTPTTITTCTDTESVRKMVESAEPAWDMITSKAVKITSPSTEKSDPYPRVKSPEELERQIVQVSVARQVSVSRARTRVQKAASIKQPLRPQLVELTKNRRSAVGVVVTPGEEEDLPEFLKEHVRQQTAETIEGHVSLPEPAKEGLPLQEALEAAEMEKALPIPEVLVMTGESETKNDTPTEIAKVIGPEDIKKALLEAQKDSREVEKSSN